MAEHPMQPPPGFVRQCVNEVYSSQSHVDTCDVRFARLAYAAGADAQLERDVEWLEQNCGRWEIPASLRAAMRPKPPSLKRQALDALDRMPQQNETETIRRALEALSDDQ